MPITLSNNAEEVNEKLHQMIGQELLGEELGEGFLVKLSPDGKYYYPISKEESLIEINKLDDDNFKNLYQVIQFYYPRRIAYLAIQKNDAKYSYAEFASDNELLLALTSIIDWLYASKKIKGGYSKKFATFLTNNLSEDDIRPMIENCKVVRQGNEHELTCLDKFAEYVYEVRSWIVHNAELTGMYPYSLKIDFEIGTPTTAIGIIAPREFRRLLWKAVLNHFGLKFIDS